MEGKRFFLWLRGRTKVYRGSQLKNQFVNFFLSSSSFWWGFGLSVQHTTFCRGVELGFFSVELCWRMCFFTKNPWSSDRCLFSKQAASLKRVVGVLLSVLGALVTESEANQISEVYDVTAYHCAWNLGISKKTETSRHRTRGFWHGCFASDIWSYCSGDSEKNCTAGKVPSWQVGACHPEAGGSERTRKTCMSCLRVWVS